MDAILIVLLVVALLVIGVLSVIALRMTRLARAAERAQQERLEAQAQQQAETRQQREQGLRVIGMALLDDQVGISEACLRLAWLIEALEWSAAERSDYGAILDVAAAVDHIPTHDQWQALPAAERRTFERQMAEIEAAHAEAVREAVRRLLTRVA
ncbi:MAG: DUF2489 domain-containing protein [Spongiibacteraceae bacterium]|jgi:type II secretory pathway pseudopilin PulG|nr:DUF2489 domain-containing protein [Spongiibacteraceae bacterium]